MELAVLIVVIVAALLAGLIVYKTVRIVPQARARNVERLGRYRKTLEPGMNLIMPFIDRVKPLIDLREQVVSFLGQPVITEDNLVVKIDTVLFFQVTDPRAADYEIVNYIQAIEQLTATMLRSVIGSMDLELTLTSRDKINTMLRGVLDDASGKWGIRVTRVEIKAIDPPKSVIDAMEKQMRAEREKRAAILNAEGIRQSQILTADGDKQGNILRAEGEKQSAILKAEGQAQAIGTVFQSIHANDPDPKLLAYQYLQTLPQLAQGPGNTVWMIPSEVTSALKTLSSAFDAGGAGGGGGGRGRSAAGSGENGSGPAGRAAWAEQMQSLAGGGGPAELPGQAGPAEAVDAAGGASAVTAGPSDVTAGTSAGTAGTSGGTAAGSPGEVTAAASAEAAGAVREADEKLAAAVQEAADGAVEADPGASAP
jgi:regulator of protease activity HflC (stomatin/prohibitin superfamily)